MRLLFIVLFHLTCTGVLLAQSGYDTPPENEIPEKLKNISREIQVIHFPKENDPVKIKNTYYWKHMTSILYKKSDITITEYGAYIYYNDQWNLRKIYALKDLDRTFGTEKNFMNQGQPYTWVKNYRTDSRLFGGWALWYFIGIDANGNQICGYETINTTSNLLN